MRDFSLTRYIRSGLAFILAISVIGGLMAAFYCAKKQTYVATAKIKYCGDGVSDGYTPNGAVLDSTEVYSPTVISRALEDLDISSGTDDIRSGITVSEIISDDQKALNEALLDKGDEVTYKPDEYTVTLAVGNDHSKSYARSLLSAILDNYCRFYTEKYVSASLTLEPSKGLLEKGYDYYESIEILDSNTSEILEYIKDKKTNYPDYRASSTGYSYSDLYDMFDSLSEFSIPAMYAKTVDEAHTKNRASLQKSLQQKIENSSQEETVYEKRKEYLLSLIDNYSEKNRDMINYHYHNDSDENGNSSSYILKQVEAYESNQGQEITYDSLILEYVEIEKAISVGKINRASWKEILDSFSRKKDAANASINKELEASINSYEETLSSYYDLLKETDDEHNAALSTEYVKIVNSVVVNEGLNTKLYTLIGAVFALILGCGLAAVVGRVKEMFEYAAHIDKKTGLPNREYVDIVISGYEKNMLPGSFTVMFFELANLTGISHTYGYAAGDNALGEFGQIAKKMIGASDFIGYNGSGKLLAILPDCSFMKAKAIIKVFNDQLGKYNALNDPVQMQAYAVFANTDEDLVYDIRGLVQSASARLDLMAAEQNPAQEN